MAGLSSLIDSIFNDEKSKFSELTELEKILYPLDERLKDEIDTLDNQLGGIIKYYSVRPVIFNDRCILVSK